ncbi:MAG: YbaB/EbfC family nucleoid-associated protein [Cyanobacteria bacterium P01_H01_bin.74]
MFDMAKMMKKAQEMQGKMKDVQDKMETQTFTGTAGGDGVTITCNGKYEFASVKISTELITDNDMRETLEDLLLAALKDVSHSVSSEMKDKMEEITQGLNIPGLKMPF